MKCLVTGAAGFIGSHLCEELIVKGYDVIGIDNLSAGKMKNIQHLDLRYFKFIKCDILDTPLLEWIFKNYNPEIVFNQMASKKTVCLADPKKDCDVNAKGTLNLLQLSKKYNVKKFIHASTGSVYGEHKVALCESTYRTPCSYYGISKLAGENYVNLYAKHHGLNATILRYFHVYGERQDCSNVGGVVAIFINNMLNGIPMTIFGDGEQKRLFTYVKDVVFANIAAIDYDCGIFNVANNKAITLHELVREIQTIINDDSGKNRVEYTYWQEGDIINFKIDNSLVKKELGIKFTDFKVGLRKTIDNWK